MSKNSDSVLRAEHELGAGVRGKYAERYRRGPMRTRERKLSVFLAHSSRDRFLGREIAERLREHCVRVWLDEAEIEMGDSFREKISPLLDQIDYVAIVLTHNSVDCDWVQTELPTAIEEELRERHVVHFALLLEPVEIPSFLRDRFCADLTTPERFEQWFPRVLRGIGAVEEEPVRTTGD